MAEVVATVPSQIAVMVVLPTLMAQALPLALFSSKMIITSLFDELQVHNSVMSDVLLSSYRAVA